MGRMYSVPFTEIAVTAQQDFFEITAASGVPIAIHSIELAQSTEVGDAQEEGLAILIKRGSSSTTSGNGTSVTPVAVVSSDTGATFTAERNATTKMATGGGSIITLRAYAWNIRIPFIMIFPPETRPVVVGLERLTVELATTPADSITISGTLMVEELV